MSFFSSLFGDKNKPAPTSVPAASAGDVVNWTLAQVDTGDGGMGVFRYREGKPAHWQSAPLSEEVSITWAYAGVLPDKATGAQMGELEEALEPLASGADSNLVLVMTANGAREWCFYCRDYDAFMRGLNTCLSGQPRFPIEIQHSHDPEWKYWHSFLDPLLKK